MKATHAGVLATSLVLIFALPGCSGGGSGGGSGSSSSGSMFIQTCSLGCGSGQTGSQVSCTTVSSYVNQDIAVYFSEEIDPASINANSLKVVDVNSGGVPPGLRLVDPLNPRKLIFRPTVAFDQSGSAVFGFDANRTYRILVPGVAQGDQGPFIRSRGGKENQSRLRCEIQTTLGVTDFVPGAPIFEARVDQAIIATPNPNDTIPNVLAGGATDVWRNSTIRLIFNDLMNPATLAPGGISSFVSMQVDLDGDLTTTGDRAPLLGTYVVQQDTLALQTTMIFTATNGIPSAGNPALGPQRKVIINVPADLRDLSDKNLANFTTPTTPVGFTPEYILLPATTLPDADGEQFANLDFYDATRSSAEWGGGKLTRGFGGGSGRHGELVVKAGETVTLNTDSQVFPLPNQAGYDILDNLQPGVDYFPGQPSLGPVSPPPVTVTNGTFEFSSVRIATGGTLLITGSKPARLFSRGPINVQGLLDVSGRNAAAQSSSLADGGAGGAGGPNGGAGGRGATRASVTAPSLLSLFTFPAITITDPMITVAKNGSPGGGVGGVLNLAAGSGGIANPDNVPTSNQADIPFLGDMIMSAPATGGCICHQVSSPGAGGAYATDGLPAVAATPTPTAIGGATNFPLFLAAGGSSSVLGIEAPGAPVVVRSLTPELGLLRGGSGGGGGGRSMFGTDSGGFPPSFCSGGGVTLQSFRDHSAGGGGGGGGAIEIVSGRTLTISGLLDAGGGDGASGTGPLSVGETRQRGASPGGGGAGGAVRALAQIIDLTGTTQVRIDVAGGVGGTNYINCRGGAGGIGLLRLETSLVPLTAAATAPHLGPQDLLLVGPNAQNMLTVGTWQLPRARPMCFSGAVSCWIKPTGNFFQVVFKDDDLGNPNPALRYAWNMDLRYDSGGGEQLIKFRGPDPALPFTPGPGQQDFQQFLGNTLNYGVPFNQGSYLAVRFQGAQLIGSLAQPCSVSLDPIDGQVLAGSLTPWVRHPGDLNKFNPRPNMMRYCVVFDTSLALFPNSIPSFIKGVTNLKIEAQPD
ncbi:MAG: hypothetical protein JNL28_07045 [Planctomycetes bacterium]|nr:hypothetical protein [Planctomycetota bacterium]